METTAREPGGSRRPTGWLALALVALVGAALAFYAGSRDDSASVDPSWPAPAGRPDVDAVATLAREADALPIVDPGPVELDPAPVPPVPRFDGRSVALVVVVVSRGDEVTDPELAYLAEYLDAAGIPYDVVDSSTQTLTASMLRTGSHGHYNAVVLTDAELIGPDGSRGFTAREWRVLHRYEALFGVREAVLSGYPGEHEVLGYDYGVDPETPIDRATGAFTGDAAEVFAGVRLDAPLEIEGRAVVPVRLRPDERELIVTPLMTMADDPDRVLISRVRYPDGRDVVVSGIRMVSASDHARFLLRDLVEFATRGLHVGAPRVHLGVHVDDLFLPSPGWDAEANAVIEGASRLDRDDVEAVLATQRGAEGRAGIAGLFVELAFNGVGADVVDGQVDDELTGAIIDHRDELRFLNHTFTHRDLDVSAGATATHARDELLWNRVVWDELALPQPEENASVVVTGEHSGVYDDPRTGDPADVVAYPDGFNDAMGSAFDDAGVRYLAGDASEPNQDAAQAVEGHDLVLVPRWPTGILTDARTPEELVDQHDWFFRESFLERGIDPCTVPAATCTRSTFDEIIAGEADRAVDHMLSFRPWPHFLHVSNLTSGPEGGPSLLDRWLEATLDRYEAHAVLPVQTPVFADVVRQAEADLAARAASPVAVLDLDAGEVTIVAGRPATIPMTGLQGGEPYGGVLHSVVDVGDQPVVRRIADAR